MFVNNKTIFNADSWLTVKHNGITQKLAIRSLNTWASSMFFEIELEDARKHPIMVQI